MTLETREEIDLWLKSAPEGACIRAYAQSPNGGDGGPTGEWSWISREHATELIARRDWTLGRCLYVNDETLPQLELVFEPPCRPGYGPSIQYLNLYYRPCPAEGRDHVSYIDSNGDLEWVGSCYPTGPHSLELVLRELQLYEPDIAPLGLTSIPDYTGQDGLGFALVEDERVFRAVLAACHLLDHFVDPEEFNPRDIYDAILEAIHRAGLRD